MKRSKSALLGGVLTLVILAWIGAVGLHRQTLEQPDSISLMPSHVSEMHSQTPEQTDSISLMPGHVPEMGPIILHRSKLTTVDRTLVVQRSALQPVSVLTPWFVAREKKNPGRFVVDTKDKYCTITVSLQDDEGNSVDVYSYRGYSQKKYEYEDQFIYAVDVRDGVLTLVTSAEGYFQILKINILEGTAKWIGTSTNGGAGSISVPPKWNQVDVKLSFTKDGRIRLVTDEPQLGKHVEMEQETTEANMLTTISERRNPKPNGW